MSCKYLISSLSTYLITLNGIIELHLLFEYTCRFGFPSQLKQSISNLDVVHNAVLQVQPTKETLPEEQVIVHG